MEANPVQIIGFFNGFKQSVIPLFQRAYEWDEGKWATLWQDVLERYEAEKELNHFMGAIVTMPAKSVPVGVSKYMIIDGQQRLTTMALLLCAIRDELSPEMIPLRKRIQNHYLTNDGYDDWEYLKILPTQLSGDRISFRTLVLGEADDGTSNIFAAYKYFRRKVRGKTGEGESIDLPRLMEAIEHRLMVVSINLGESDDPYLIFESLNFKGSPLTQADLVRNYFLMRFNVQEQQKVYDKLWIPMQERLSASLTEFMRQYLMKDGEEVVKAEIYPAIKKRVADKESAAVESELRTMSDYSGHYTRIIKPENEPSPDLRKCLSRIGRWDLTTSHPLLLRLYDAYRRERLSTDGFVDCLRTVESFVVRRTVCDVPTNQLKRIFLQVARNFVDTETPIWLRGELASGSYGARWPKDEEFREAWESYRAYNSSRIDRCALILEALEESYKHKEEVAFEKASIEHVMPVTLTREWAESIGDEVEETHSRYLHTIGNLTLTGYNSELSNDQFSKKKIKLGQSHYELNKHFGTIDSWGKAQIMDRSRVLWEQARQIWVGPLHDGDAEPDKDSDAEADTAAAKERINAAASLLKMHAADIEDATYRYHSQPGGELTHFKYSKYYKRQDNYWYGIKPGLLAEMENLKCSQVAFVLGDYGVACVPVQLLREYLSNAGTTKNRDNGIRHYHILISAQPTVELYTSAQLPRFSLAPHLHRFDCLE